MYEFQKKLHLFEQSGIIYETNLLPNERIFSDNNSTQPTIIYHFDKIILYCITSKTNAMRYFGQYCFVITTCFEGYGFRLLIRVATVLKVQSSAEENVNISHLISKSREVCREVTPHDMVKAQASAAATDAGEGVFGGEVLPWFEGEGSVNCIRFRETDCAE